MFEKKTETAGHTEKKTFQGMHVGHRLIILLLYLPFQDQNIGSGPTTKCSTCGLEVPFFQLRKHINDFHDERDDEELILYEIRQ